MIAFLDIKLWFLLNLIIDFLLSTGFLKIFYALGINNLKQKQKHPE